MTRIEVTDEQIAAAQAGDSMAMWEIVQAFDSMFHGMIRKVGAAGTVHEEDLLQEARAVLIQHVRDYDTDASSAKLSSFVFQAARRKITEENVRETTALSVDPTTVLRVRRALWNAGGDVEEAWKTLSSCSNTSGRMERERFMAALEAIEPTESFDAPANGGTDADALTLSDIIADTSADVTNATERRDLARWLMTQIAVRQAFALRAFYGVQMTQQADSQTCAELGIKAPTLRGLRKSGIESAQKVADLHGLTA